MELGGMKILNAYCGIGGNRKLWGSEHDITAIEYDPKIADIYKDNFPNDNVIVTDAHQYILNHYEEYDFIWSSPPCPSHSKLRSMQEKKIYPEMELYQQIIFLKFWFNGKFCIENVEPYYGVFIPPTATLHRHFFWSNFFISKTRTERLETCKKIGEREFLQEKLGFDLSKYSGIDKRKCLRNCVVPEVGKFILDELIDGQQKILL